jgi:hypothetical protein
MTAHRADVRERHDQHLTDYVAGCSCGWSVPTEYRLQALRAIRRHLAADVENNETGAPALVSSSRLRARVVCDEPGCGFDSGLVSLTRATAIADDHEAHHREGTI